MPDNNIRRNDSCPCGSGRRYKDCHGALRPEGSESLSEIARAGLAQGRLEEAARDARAAIERDATDADAWTVLGLALEAAQPDAALDAWHRAIALAPRQPEAHFRIGDFRRRRSIPRGDRTATRSPAGAREPRRRAEHTPPLCRGCGELCTRRRAEPEPRGGMEQPRLLPAPRRRADGRAHELPARALVRSRRSTGLARPGLARYC